MVRPDFPYLLTITGQDPNAFVFGLLTEHSNLCLKKKQMAINDKQRKECASLLPVDAARGISEASKLFQVFTPFAWAGIAEIIPAQLDLNLNARTA
jgi:hypothetical protein